MKSKKNNKTSQIFDKDKMLLSSESPFSVQEAFKTLRTNVLFSLPGAGSKCICVTSANRNEGKSTISINLAISFAQMNKKVIIIDSDLRLPTVASKLDINNSIGLSNHLASTEKEDTPAIQHMEDLGIDVLTSGNIPPEPTVLLTSDAMEQLITDLKKEYDIIIMDCPPIFIVSDAVLLTKIVDGYLIVVRQDSSEYSEIDETLRQMEFADAKIIGFVYNAKKTNTMLEKGGKYYKYK